MRNWLSLAFFWLFWGGWMLMWEIRKRKAANIEPALLPASILHWTCAGLLFGLVMTFRWNALRWPIVAVTAASFLGASATSMLYSRQRDKAILAELSWWRTACFFLVMVGLALILANKARPLVYATFVAALASYVLHCWEWRKRRSQELTK